MRLSAIVSANGRTRRWLVAACGALVCAGGLTAPAAASDTGPLWPNTADWQRYVLAPANRDVHPVSVVGVSGSVTNADALVHPAPGRVATLTRSAGDTGATDIVLDYGRDVGGLPMFTVTAESGSPTLQAGYSETRTQIGPTGDGAAPWASGDPKRYDSYSVTAPGTITNQYVQGGERYEEISLTSPGSVSLSAVEIRFEAYLGTPNTYQGYFLSSSDQLNRMWYDGAYTVQLDQVPPGAADPELWRVQQGALVAGGSGDGAGLLKTGATWTDYSTAFRTAIDDNQAGWVVHGTGPQDGYLFILDAANDAVGTPNALQEVVASGGNYRVVANVPLPFAVQPGTWYDVRTTVSGSVVTTYLNGQQVASFDSSQFPAGAAAFASGTVGFREYTGEQARFAGLSVTAPGGQVLYGNALSDPTALSDFAVPGNNTMPVVLDGAKRDRAIWSGDMSVEGPTLFYSTAANDYLRDSLLLLGSYQGADGYTTGDLPPQTPLHTGAPLPTVQGAYSASYSMYFVRGLAEYYQYTADTAFAEQEWPVVQRELAWSASQVDGRGLFVTNSGDGNDWDYYDGPKTGAVTEYNALYYQTLLDGATLADATGHPDLAAGYRSRAQALRTAINATLFNAQTGVYDVSDTVRGTVAQDANSLAVLFGVAPRNRAASILAALKSALWTTYGPRPYSAGYQTLISPFVSGYEALARLASGDDADAVSLLSTLWGPMVAPGPYFTGGLWENTGADGVPQSYTSLAHGWASTPTSALSEYVLGIQPVTAGYSTWLVQPHPADLAWTQGQAPTPHGTLAVKWGQDTQAHRFAMRIDAPRGTSGTIAVPTFGRQVSVRVNGRVVWNGGPVGGAAHLDGGYLDVPVAGGGQYLVDSSPMR
jgi:alpha-L-rhamnosidase